MGERQEWLIDLTSWMYLNSHFVITTTALAWIYLRRNDSFYFVRNMFWSRWASRWWATSRSPPRRRG